MRILYVTTISLTMNSFFKPHIEMLIREGHTVDLACNATDRPLDVLYHDLGCQSFQIDFSRSPLSPSNVRAYKQLDNVIKNGHYDVVHCHTPNASVITRLVCRKYRKENGLKVFYTAHGFHFFKGAPKQNWMVYYPVEKWCSRYTDKLITINIEDYTLAKQKFHAEEVHYIPGVGVDLSRFEGVQTDKAEKRYEIGVPENAFLLLSVGELNVNKNHQVIVRALAQLSRKDIHYAIAGEGDQRDSLTELAASLGVSDRVHLLGYQNDIPKLMYAADVFCFPSHREGLGLAAIEAMACGLPLITSNVHGINDYSENGVTGYKCASTDVEGFAKAIEKSAQSKEERERIGEYNRTLAKKYDVIRIVDIMKTVYFQ